MLPGRNPTVFHPHFSPWLADSEQLSHTLVGHHGIIRDFLARLQAVEQGGTANHTLLVGPRGIGKTHVLCLVERYVSDRLRIPQDWTSPSKAWVSVLFTEEEYAGQNSLANFLLTLFTKLREALPLEQLWNLPEHLHQEADQVVTDCCFERLERFHREKNQRILLVIDNLQKVLQQWPEPDHQRLRSFLSHNNLLVILSSAPSVFREVMDQKAAFHDFFEVRILPELSNEQMLELLSRRFQQDGRQQEFEARRQELSKKIPAIELLTGGNPRLVLFLYQIATRSAFLDIEVALRNLLEELREYFVRRFDELPDQARKVLDTIAQMPGPATPTEISHAARLQPALVNAQLKRLKEGHYVRPIKLQRQKSTRYDITERLFRIWRQTATVAGRQRFRFLADFLKLYFTPEEVRALYAHHTQYLRTAVDVPREEIIRHVEELFYFQAAGENEIRYGAFSSRMESLVRIGELRWAEEEAEHFAAESLKQDDKPGATAAYKTEAAIHLQTGRYSDALKDIEALIKLGAAEEAASAAESLVKANPSSAEGWRWLGMSLDRLGEHARALNAFCRAAKGGKPSPALTDNLAVSLETVRQWEEALRCAEQAVALDDRATRGWEELGIAAGSLGQHERALEALRRAAEVGKPTARLWATQAIALGNLRRWDEALRCAEQAVALDASAAGGWEQLGVAANNLGHHERALEALRRAAELGELSAWLWTSQAIVLKNLRRWEEALRCAEQAVALDASAAGGWEELGIAAGNLGHHERALEAFRKAVEAGEPSAVLWTNQAIALINLSRREEALRCAEQAVALDASFSRGWEALGIAANNLGQHERALEAFRKAAEVGEASPRILRLQAKALRNLGRHQEALSVIETALTSDPDSAGLWHEKAWTLAALERLGEALECVERAHQHGASAREYHHDRGDLLLLSGQFADALNDLDAGLKIEPNDWDLQTDRLIALGCLGQHGPLMEALPAALAQVQIPPASVSTICDFMCDVALNCLGRGESQTSRGLFAATLGTKSWHRSESFGKQAGNFLRRVLDVKPEMFQSFVNLLAERVNNEDVLKLLDPFLKASDFLRTKDLTILERLFPEVRELVLDIVRRVAPDLNY